MIFIDEIALKKLGAPDGWEPFIYTRVGDTNDLIVTVGPPKVLQRGPRKGQKTWQGQERREVVVTANEIKAAREEYEAETGTCSRCSGTGSYNYGWSAKEGPKFKSCPYCNGTGAPEHALHTASGASNPENTGQFD